MFEVHHRSFKKLEKQGSYIKTIAKCPAYNRTNIIHKMFAKELSRNQEIKEFIINNSRK